MIDTIRLAVDTKTIPCGFRFAKSKSDIFSGTIYPPKELRNSGKYFPKITFCKRPKPQGFSQQILIEFSIPKLLYGNNFSEVCDTDFDTIVETLRARMREMGFKWRRSSSIKKYSVVRVDYSKNIVFTDGATVSQILRLFQAADISRTIDVAAGDFRNGGQILHLHTNGRDIALYDKVADLKQSKRSEKRAYEQDNKCQHELLFSLQNKPELAVLRYEIRLNSTREIRANLAKIEQDTSNLSFQHLFSSDISKSILLYWWNKMLSTLPKAPLDSMDTIENLFLGLLQDERATPQRVFATLGYHLLTTSEHYDARFTREVFDRRFKPGSWMRSSKLLLTPKAPQNLRHLIFIKQTIRDMQPLKIEEYQHDLEYK